MDEVLQHDPRTKQMIKDMLYAFLYDPVQKKFKQRLDAIITKNTVLLGATHNSFIYRNVVYSCDTQKMPRKMNRLVPQLVPVMEEYLKDAQQLNNSELPYVLGFINQVLNASNDLHDYLKVLPSALHQPIEALIATCPCRTKKLSDQGIAELQKANQSAVELIKQRMVTNLII